MSYTKTNWNNGDVITAEKLNNIESGVEAAGGGVKLGLIDTDEYGLPSGTLGDVRAVVNAGMIPYGRHIVDGTEFVRYMPCEFFADNGTGESHSFIQFKNIQYQSTSGSDDATWEVYD